MYRMYVHIYFVCENALIPFEIHEVRVGFESVSLSRMHEYEYTQGGRVIFSLSCKYEY